MISSINPKEFIKVQNAGKEHIIEAFAKGGIDFNDDGSELDKEKLIEFDVLDYDDYSSMLLPSESYSEHLKTYTDVNIKDIYDKQKIIKRLRGIIAERRKTYDDYSLEVKKINSTLRAIKNIINKAIASLNEKEMKFKAEVNLEVRKINLTLCKEDLVSLIEAVNKTDEFLHEHYPFFVDELDENSISHYINMLSHHTYSARENIDKTLKELSKYLIHIEKEAKKIERLNHLYKLKINGELFEKSNIEYVFLNIKERSESFKLNQLYEDDERLTDELIEYVKKLDEHVPKIEDNPDIRPEPIKEERRVKEKPILPTRVAYSSFKKQDLDLASFLMKKDLNKKNFISIFVRIAMQYSIYLNVSKDNVIIHKGVKFPHITNKR